ncbi:hypothetical protein I4U23_001443 [Adineta vaga]|nr:hypothetical protein I4U23_001443 [Adineta vaga]
MTYDELKEIIRTSQSSSNRLELLVIAKDAHALLSQEDIFIKAASAKIIETPRVMPIEYKYFHKYQPRTCIIDLHEKDTSFGLTIAEGENKIGLFIEEIKPKSPASKTSLRKYDRIIEINDKYVDNDSSDSILKKLNKAETRRSVKLYVVDTETYRYFKANKIPLSSSGLRKSQSIKLFQEMNNKHLTLKNQSTPNRTEPSKVHHISNPEISILQEDIRLCTILRTNSRDPPGFVIDYNQKERSHVLNIVPSCQNRLSDAELAGIKPNDRLIEINGKNIENLTNEEIKQRIHAIKYPNSLQLLVVDVPTYHYYQQQNKRIYRKLSNVCILPPNIPSPSNIPPPRPTDPKPTSLLNTSKSKESSILSSQPRIIIIKKCSNSFGFNFHTISNENSLYSHVITSIDVNFQINLSNLHLNDYILSINNENIEHFTHEQLINLLDRLNNNETILLLVAEKTIYQQYLEILRMNKLSKHNSSKNIRQYRLKANQNFENYGFSVQTKGISFRIISIKPLSPASNAGLSIGDYIIRVNNQLVVKMKLDKLISLIQDETKIIDGHLLLEVTNEDTYRSISLYPQIRLCTIRSWAHYKDLGFEIIRATNILTNDQAYRIQQLQLESPAAYTQVYNGDYIIEVNEQNIEEKTLHDVYQLIGYSYHQEGRVTLLIVDDHGYKWYRDNRIQIDPSSEKINLIRYII